MTETTPRGHLSAVCDLAAIIAAALDSGDYTVARLYAERARRHLNAAMTGAAPSGEQRKEGQR